jgi:hypothetical protein
MGAFGTDTIVRAVRGRPKAMPNIGKRKLLATEIATV